MKIRNAEPKDAEQLDMMLTRLIQDESRYDRNLNRECEIKDNYCNRIGLDGHKLILIEENGEIYVAASIVNETGEKVFVLFPCGSRTDLYLYPNR